jgi:hypothetical protein
MPESGLVAMSLNLEYSALSGKKNYKGSIARRKNDDGWAHRKNDGQRRP